MLIYYTFTQYLCVKLCFCIIFTVDDLVCRSWDPFMIKNHATRRRQEAFQLLAFFYSKIRVQTFSLIPSTFARIVTRSFTFKYTSLYLLFLSSVFLQHFNS